MTAWGSSLEQSIVVSIGVMFIGVVVVDVSWERALKPRLRKPFSSVLRIHGDQKVLFYPASGVCTSVLCREAERFWHGDFDLFLFSFVALGEIYLIFYRRVHRLGDSIHLEFYGASPLSTRCLCCCILLRQDWLVWSRLFLYYYMSPIKVAGTLKFALHFFSPVLWKTPEVQSGLFNALTRWFS